MATTEFHPLLVGIMPRTEKLFFRLWSDHGLTYEEIADLYETTEDHVEWVMEGALARYERWARQQ